jgi:multidrug efflux pump
VLAPAAPPSAEQRSALYRLGERGFNALRDMYAATLAIALAHRRLTLLSLAGAIGLNVYLFGIIPKGLIPQQDTGRMMGSMQADQSISFQLMSKKLISFIDGGEGRPRGGRGGRLHRRQCDQLGVRVRLAQAAERAHVTSDQVIERLRDKLVVPGARCTSRRGRTCASGGRQGNAQYQYTLQADELSELYAWTPRITKALSQLPELSDVSSDQQEQGLETDLVIDRASASRLQLSASVIDNTLYDAFGQRQVSTIYNPLNQYHVVMEVAPQYWQDPETLNDLYISTSGGAVSGTQQTNAVAGTVVDAKVQGGTPSNASIANDAARNARLNALANTTHSSTSTGAAISTASETMIPLSSFSHFGPGTMPLAVNHQGHFAAATITFNQPPGYSLSDAEAAITSTMAGSASPSRSTAASRAPPRPSRMRRAAISCSSSPPCSRSTSCSASSTRASSTPSPSSPPCRRPGSARCSPCSGRGRSSTSSP